MRSACFVRRKSIASKVIYFSFSSPEAEYYQYFTYANPDREHYSIASTVGK